LGRYPLFEAQIYHKLGDQGAKLLLAGLVVLMVPIPFVLGWYGKKIREGSPWASVYVKNEKRDWSDEVDETDDREDEEGPKSGGRVVIVE
jgi:hypothetical protein